MIRNVLFGLWCAACALGGVTVLAAMFDALDGRAAMFCIGCSESLDKAQAEFERQEHAKFNDTDFDAWRKTGDMSCQNATTLRICRAHPVVIAAGFKGIDQPVRQFVSFACSTTECAWVDP